MFIRSRGLIENFTLETWSLIDETTETTFPAKLSEIVSFRRTHSEDDVSGRGTFRAQFHKKVSEDEIIPDFPEHVHPVSPSPRDPNLRRWYDRTVQNESTISMAPSKASTGTQTRHVSHSHPSPAEHTNGAATSAGASRSSKDAIPSTPTTAKTIGSSTPRSKGIAEEMLGKVIGTFSNNPQSPSNASRSSEHAQHNAHSNSSQ
jgi:hypothetical protein